MFKAWPKIPRLENEIYHITEKIDGTNACIVILDISSKADPEGLLFSHGEAGVRLGVLAQSRTRIITPEDDNFGFAKWVKDNAEQLMIDLGEGYHYGEWWGKGINRGYGLEERRFSLFNPTKHSTICFNVPYISTYYWMPDERELKEQLSFHGSYAIEGYMRPEGLVIYAEKAKSHWKIIIDK